MVRWKVGAAVALLVAVAALGAVQEAARLSDVEVRVFLDGIHGKRVWFAKTRSL